MSAFAIVRGWLPRTMSGLVAAGCVLAAAPLLVALLMAGMALDQLSRHSELLAKEGVTLTRLGLQLRENVSDLERSARQYVALGDAALLDVFFSRVLVTESTLRSIEEERFQTSLAGPILRVRQGLTDATQTWVKGLEEAQSLAAAVERIRSLDHDVDEIMSSGYLAVDSQMRAMREASANARRVMVVSSVALLPLTALLAFAFSAAITRPLRRLGQGIAALGHGRHEQPIVIRYPREMERLAQQLDWLRRRLGSLEQDKDRFLRHVSHELKTPLASLIEGSELLYEPSFGPLTDRQLEVVKILSEAAQELGGLIHNLLAYAEWREGRHQAEMTWFEAQPLIEEVLRAHRLPMTKRGLSVELEVHSPRLFGQRSRLRIVLDNLLANAVKHAAPDTALEVHAATRDSRCELWVRDRGRGVPEPERQRIFEPFVRGTEAEETGIRGTGVGLSIVRETVLAHGGTVEVEDANPGARFKLAWPCPHQEPATATRSAIAA